MAGENITNNPRDWGHRKSPIFKLPPEIRNKIYAETFEGSEISLVIDPPPSVAVVPITGRHSVFNTANSNHHILLTCRMVYLEALALYWTTVIVRNGCDGHFSLAYFLDRIPTAAKRYIQHLRDVKLNIVPIYTTKLLRGEVIRWSPSLAEFLDQFPNLKSCLLTDWSLSPRSSRSVAVECDEAIARHPGVNLIDKTFTYETVPEDPNNPHGPTLLYDSGDQVLLRRYIFENRATGSKVSWSQSIGVQAFSDEACIEALMSPPPIEPQLNG